MIAIQAAAALVFYPLRFGDQEQIEAIRLIDELQYLKAALTRDRAGLCLACKGKTYITSADCECGDAECDLCARGWMEACGSCQEIGLVLDGEPWPTAQDASPEARRALCELLIYTRAAADKRGL